MNKTSDVGLLVSRVGVGLLLLIAGWQKWSEPESFAQIIGHYALLPEPLIPLVALSLPGLEILVGTLLLVGWLTRPAALIAAALSLGFSVFIGSAVARGLDVVCGCFTGESKVSRLHVGLDMGMLIAAAVVAKWGSGRWSLEESVFTKSDSTDHKLPAITTVTLLSLNLAYLTKEGPPHLARPIPISAIQGTPEVIFDPPVLKLGTIKQEDKVELTATYKNLGTGPAEISGVKSSCGCTSAKLEKRELLPGESASLRVTYEAGANRGEVHQNVRLTVEGQIQQPMLQVEGDVSPMVSVTPGVVELVPNEAKSIHLTARERGAPLAFLGVGSPVDILKFRSRPKEDGSLEIEVLATATIPPTPGGDGVWPVQLQVNVGPPVILYVKGKEKP